MFSEKGASLMELVVVVGVSAIVVGALVFATIASLRNAQFSKNQAQATKLAQEGIERVRAGRDRNQAIKNLGDVTSWNGDTGSSGSIWNYKIFENCSSSISGSACYFKFDDTASGALRGIGLSDKFPTTGAEPIPPAFHRAVILSDDASFASQKTVTVVVSWTDFSGPHQSRLTTILRKI